jgi:hypothetical protein
MKNKLITTALIFSSVYLYGQDSKSNDKPTRLEIAASVLRSQRQGLKTALGCTGVFVAKGVRLGVIAISESLPVANTLVGIPNYMATDFNSNFRYKTFRDNIYEPDYVKDNQNPFRIPYEVYYKSKTPSLLAGGILTAIGESVSDTVDYIDGGKIQDHKPIYNGDKDGWFDKTKKVYVMTRYYANDDDLSLDINNGSWCSNARKTLDKKVQETLEMRDERSKRNSTSALTLTSDTRVAAVNATNVKARAIGIK